VLLELILSLYPDTRRIVTFFLFFLRHTNILIYLHTYLLNATLYQNCKLDVSSLLLTYLPASNFIFIRTRLGLEDGWHEHEHDVFDCIRV